MPDTAQSHWCYGNSPAQLWPGVEVWNSWGKGRKAVISFMSRVNLLGHCCDSQQGFVGEVSRQVMATSVMGNTRSNWGTCVRESKNSTFASSSLHTHSGEKVCRRTQCVCGGDNEKGAETETPLHHHPTAVSRQPSHLQLVATESCFWHLCVDY